MTASRCVCGRRWPTLAARRRATRLEGWQLEIDGLELRRMELRTCPDCEGTRIAATSEGLWCGTSAILPCEICGTPTGCDTADEAALCSPECEHEWHAHHCLTCVDCGGPVGVRRPGTLPGPRGWRCLLCEVRELAAEHVAMCCSAPPTLRDPGLSPPDPGIRDATGGGIDFDQREESR